MAGIWCRSNADELAAGCADGMFEKLDWSAIGGKDHYQAMAVSDCGVGAFVHNTVLAWDRDKFQATPTWADFWDVAKIPGKRGLAKSVRGALEFALLADGVAPADVYKTLATSDGVDRAFRKLDQLKPYIVWWQTPAEAAKILGSGDVLMTTTPSSVIVTANRGEKRNFGIQFAASLYEPRSWAMHERRAEPPRGVSSFCTSPARRRSRRGLFRVERRNRHGERRERLADAGTAGAVAHRSGQCQRRVACGQRVLA